MTSTTLNPNDIPVIDLFAGPGGLSHGFGAHRNKNISFRTALSVEMDVVAHRTLHLRAFIRQFGGDIPEEYYRYIRSERGITLDVLQKRYPLQWAIADAEAKNWELGKHPFTEVSAAINTAIAGASFWILLGGPPCQAYSLAGRARMKNDVDFANDNRHTLYQEYLKIVAVHQPPVFVMENVKGILSATHGTRTKGESIFQQILEDLRKPAEAVRAIPDIARQLPGKQYHYTIYSFVTKGLSPELLEPHEFVIRSEDWGVPQSRHRVILLGVREDVSVRPKTLSDMFSVERTNIEEVLSGLPKLRSRLSKEIDNRSAWLAAVKTLLGSKTVDSVANPRVRDILKKRLRELKAPRSVGSSFQRGIEKFKPLKLADWLWDKKLKGVIQHQARGHMSSDLSRYFYAACAALDKGISPTLYDFPTALLPKHKNANGTKKRAKNIVFSDRFRVQVRNRPATTITSHISKDGHYYIHYDPDQCRSLTVREAARLQTFPDTYFFEGRKTEQYHQVGNAVPPLLAEKLACIVADLLCRERLNSFTVTSKRAVGVG